MSRLTSLLRSLHSPPANAANPANQEPTQGGEPNEISSISTISRGACAQTHFDAEPAGEAEQPFAALTARQEKARRAVLARLEADPGIVRAFVSRWEDGNMVLTLAVRHVGTCELQIPGDRLAADSLADYDRLAVCILNAERPA